MTVCANVSEIGAAFDAFMRDEVDGTVAAAAQEAVRLYYGYSVTIKTTWSPMQPGDTHTGQFRYSTNISIGSPNLASLPTLEGEPWPIASRQYGVSDVIAGAEVIPAIRAYDTVYITNTAPHAGKVEAHAGVFRLAAELASRDLASMDWQNVSAGRSIPF